eukprot:TRINITY_DN1808_c0_g1_i1.p1 TRINITY_DN1808_c0_g1~~TRINITY_DN1808_c0_g1_i1.p1  ORF type:complete len:327 (+),score=76.55 TRINITY_DN1808_c0_g1_i1:67-1047(+)
MEAGQGEPPRAADKSAMEGTAERVDVEDPAPPATSPTGAKSIDAYDYRRVDLGGDEADFGKTTVCFGGRCVMGPDQGTCMFSMGLIIAPMVAFLSFAAKLHPAFVVFALLLIAASIGSLVVTGCTDPGIIPKRPPPPNPPAKEDQEREVVTPHGPITVKWCTTCHIWRPLRTSHCSDCGNCVARFDHHCPWTGTCIGGRNYKYFYLFLAFTTVLCLYVMAVSIYEIVDATRQEKADNVFDRVGAGSKRSSHLALVVIFYALCISCCVGNLCCYHTSLVLSNKTTHEEIKYVSSKPSPFDAGCSANCAEVFCEPFPSKIGRILHRST